MRKDQIVMGVIIAISCLWGFQCESWILHETGHGRRLQKWFGPEGGVWALRVLLMTGVVFGALLAAHVIHPIQW